MKKFLTSTLAALAALAIISCTEQGTKPITVYVQADETEISELSSPEKYEVTLTSLATAVELKAESDNGIAVFANIVPGLYKVVAKPLGDNAEVEQGGYTYLLSGTLEEAELVSDKETVRVPIMAAVKSPLIFKEIYYSGAKGDNYYMRDQFYEIYNNGDKTVYADGLCISETIYAAYDFSVIYDYQVPGKNSRNYVFAPLVWQIRGNGTQYPIEPGESFIIAQWGADHTTANRSKGDSKMNLEGAEFEAFCGAKEVFGGITLTDEKAINLDLAVNAQGYAPMQWLTSVSGSRYLLFKPTAPLRKDNYLTPSNVTEATTLGALEIPISSILDGVQAISDETGLQHLGLPAILDAGAIWCSGNYAGESISRKVKETLESGQVIYQDTNNTTDDFQVNKTPELRRNGAKVPAWNTWINK